MNHSRKKAAIACLALALYGCRYENAEDPPAAATCDTAAVAFSNPIQTDLSQPINHSI